MDANGSDMLNDGNFALFWTIEGIVGPSGGKIKNWRFGSYGHFGDKNVVFTSSESLFSHLEADFRISVVNSSTTEKGAPAE